MKVESLCQTDVVTVDVGDSLCDAAGVMRFQEVGSLIVYDDDVMVGIITERDLVRAVADGARPGAVAVRTYMSEQPVMASPTMEAEEAARLMLDLGIRHLPVGDGTTVVGVVSVRDLLAEENVVLTSATDLAEVRDARKADEQPRFRDRRFSRRP
jgi:CBS domain-containing protein